LEIPVRARGRESKNNPNQRGLPRIAPAVPSPKRENKIQAKGQINPNPKKVYLISGGKQRYLRKKKTGRSRFDRKISCVGLCLVLRQGLWFEKKKIIAGTYLWTKMWGLKSPYWGEGRWMVGGAGVEALWRKSSLNYNGLRTNFRHGKACHQGRKGGGKIREGDRSDPKKEKAEKLGRLEGKGKGRTWVVGKQSQGRREQEEKKGGGNRRLRTKRWVCDKEPSRLLKIRVKEGEEAVTKRTVELGIWGSVERSPKPRAPDYDESRGGKIVK